MKIGDDEERTPIDAERGKFAENLRAKRPRTRVHVVQ
jgi:hypothetical protein